MAQLLPSTQFSTDAFEGGLRFDAWRDFLPLYTVTPHPEGLDAAFEGRVVTYVLPPIGLGITSFSPQRYVRSRQRIAADGQDHFLIQLFTAGGLRSVADDGDVVMVQAGDVWVHDLARPKTVTTEASRTVTVLLPRRELLRMVGAAELDGQVLRRGTPLATLLADHLRALARAAPLLSGEEAHSAAWGTMALAAACLRPTARIGEAAREPMANALRERLKAYIDAHATSPDLTPQALCARFGISRANLYRLFAPVGGVAGYVRDRRLRRAETLLRDPANQRRTIADIAYDCGFASEAHFSRTFRQTFGAMPREVRAHGPGLLADTILTQFETLFAPR